MTLEEADAGGFLDDLTQEEMEETWGAEAVQDFLDSFTPEMDDSDGDGAVPTENN